MKTLSSLLERFKKSLGKSTINKDAVIFAVEKLTSIKLKPEEISIRDTVLEIISTPSKKNEIKLKEGLILSEVHAQTGQNISRIFYK